MDLALNNLQRLICHKNQPTRKEFKDGLKAKIEQKRNEEFKST